MNYLDLSLYAIGFIEIGQEMPKLANHSDLSAIRHVKVNYIHIPFYVFK